MELKTFKLENIEEVQTFSDRLEHFVRNRINVPVPHISLVSINLVSAFNFCQTYNEGPRLFTALLDFNINIVDLLIDFSSFGGTWNNHFSKGKLEGGSVLDDSQKFDGKVLVHHHFTNLIPRYRAIWDKIMGIFVLRYESGMYKKYCRADSRKAEFKKIFDNSQDVTQETALKITNQVQEFDDKFRTPEVHGAGSVRKWSFTMYNMGDTPMVDIQTYMNWLFEYIIILNRMFKTTT